MALEDRTVPSTFTVLNSLDSGPRSLRQAVLDANSNAGLDTISFARTVHHITLTSGELTVTDSLLVQGPGANKLAVSGNDASRAFHIQSGSVTIAGLTVTHGLADKNAPFLPSAGGGILNRSGATLALSNVVLSANRAVGDPSVVLPINAVFNEAGAGAIYNDSILTVTGSSFSRNQAIGGNNGVSPFHNGHALGGAIGSGSLLPVAGGPGATLVVSQSTFTHNQAIGGNDNVVTLPVAFIPRPTGPTTVTAVPAWSTRAVRR